MKTISIKTLIACVLFFASSALSAQTLYWTGTQGDWNNSQNWSSTPFGVGGDGIPNSSTQVIIPNQTEPVEILISGDASCLQLAANDGFGQIIISESADLYIKGDVEIGNQMEMVLNGDLNLQIESFSQVSIPYLKGNGNFVTSGEGILNLQSHILLNDASSIELKNETVLSNGFGFVCGTLNISQPLENINLEGSKSIVHVGVNVDSHININQGDIAVYLDDDVSMSDVDASNLNTQYLATRANTCGTGVGQVPFTIDAIVSSDYNGEDISCNGACDGEALATVSGGVGPFTFQWIGGESTQFTQNYPNLCVGTYTCLVTDQGQGITCVDNVQLAEPPPLSVFTFSYTPPTCEDVCDGSGQLLIIGGVPGYNYVWSTGETSPNSTQLCEGENTVTVSDLNGCSFDSTFTVEVSTLNINLSTIDIICGGTASGEASAAPVGGDGNYTFDWSNGEDGDTVTGLLAGDYTLTVSDGNGCSADTTFEILEELPMTIDLINTENPDCFGVPEGLIEVEIIGGTAPYIIEWTSLLGFTSSDEDIIDLVADTYTILVTDFNLCTATLEVELTSPGEITVDGDLLHNLCFGDNAGTIDITVNGGTPGFNYTWNGPNGFTSDIQDIADLECGIYTVVVEDFAGCQGTAEFEILCPEEILDNATVTPLTCAGINDASIFVNPSGGMPGYLFVWTSDNGFTSNDQNISNLAPGNYSLDIMDALGCSETFTYEIIEPEAIDVQQTVSEPSCPGTGDGSIELTVTGGAGDFEFLWTSTGGFNSTDEDVFDLFADDYNVIVTDAAGCFVSIDISLTDPEGVVVDSEITPVLCAGEDTGSIVIDVSGGTPDYTISWTSILGFASNDEDIFNLVADTYTLSIVDGGGCLFEQDFEVTESPALEVVSDVQGISCFAFTDGQINLEITGGVEPYTIDWQGPDFASSDEDISGLEAGTYDLTITDDAGCIYLESFEIIEPESIDASVTAEDPSCGGDSNGTITLTIEGGQEPYSVSWDNGMSGESINGLSAGTYQPTITDDNGCFVTLGEIELFDPEDIDVDATIVNIGCLGDLFGSIDLEVTGGTPDYSFSWTSLGGFTSSDEDITNLVADDYTVLITDDEGCEYQETFTIVDGVEITVDVESNNVSCFNQGDGDIEITINGGTEPFTIEWTGPDGFNDDQEFIEDLDAGTYDLTITDDIGCVFQESVEITEPEELAATIDTTDPSCAGQSDGTITLNITGGEEPYLVLWDNGMIGAELIDLPAGDYIPMISDDSNCFITLGAITLNEPDDITVAEILTNADCGNNGAIDITVSGGNGGFVFNWTGPNGFASADEDLVDLFPGEYVLNILDENDCSFDATYEIANDGVQIDEVFAEDVSCFNLADGEIEIVITGGTEPYEVEWTGPDGFDEIGEFIEDLEAGVYEATITDDNGCFTIESIEITEPTEIDVTIDPVDPTCGVGNDGSITLTITGGVEPYLVLWDGGQIGATITDLVPGVYTPIVSDDNNCFVTLPSIELFEPSNIEVDFVQTDIGCTGALLGAIDIEISGGDPAYTVSWTGPDGFVSSDEDIIDLEAGDYNLNILDQAGCSFDETFTIINGVQIFVDATTEDVSCFNVSDGSIEIEITGGTEPFTIDWAGPDGFNDDQILIEDLDPGTYDLTISDDAGCQYQESFEITEPEEIVATVDVVQPTCAGEDDGSITLTIVGGVEPYTVLWDGGQTGETIIDLGAGTYTPIITDDAGCFVTLGGIEIVDPEEITADAEITDIGCGGAEFGAIMLTPAGGTDYDFLWEGPNNFMSTGQNISNLEAGDYSVVVTDVTGCEFEATYTIEETIAVEVDIDATMISCFNVSDGEIEINITGGVEPYTIEWQGPDGFEDDQEFLEDLEAGTYNLTVTDDEGCIFEEAVEITEPEELSVVVTAIDPSCFGEPDGSITLEISGGVAPYLVLWDDGGIGEVRTDLPAGTYTPMVSDDFGCFITLTPIVLEEPSELVTTVDQVNPQCAGDATGTIETETIGGSGNYIFEWVGPNGFTSDLEDISDLESGTYSLTVTDDSGCSSITEVNLIESADIQIDAVVADLICADDIASIELEVTGGNPDFTFDWIGPNGFVSDQEDITNLEQGFYQLTVTDDTGCAKDTVFNISATDPLVVNPLVVQPLCGVPQSGSIELFITGGNPDITVSWTGAITSDQTILTNLDEGEYILHVEDALGCAYDEIITLVQPTDITVTADVSPTLCAAENTGAIDIELTGGLEPYTISWSNDDGFASDNEDIENLAPNTYNLNVTDMSGCILDTAFVVSENTPLVLDAAITDLLCAGAADGAIDLIVNGGTGVYTFDWSGPSGFGSEDEDLIDLEPGDYSVEVFDENGCDAGAIFTVQDGANIVVTINTVDSECNEANGSAEAIVEGADPATTQWFDADDIEIGTGLTISDLPAGNYTFTAVDDQGCSQTEEFSISDSNAMTLDASITDVLCNDDTNGAIDLTITDAQGATTVSWIGPNGFASIDEDISDLEPGTYQVEVTDEDLCVATATYEVGNPDEITVDEVISNLTCGDEGTGAIALTVFGGTGDYSFDWAGPNAFVSIDQDISDLDSGVYNLIISDENDCTAEFEFTIEETIGLDIQVDATETICFGEDNGSIDITVSGGSGNYAFDWTGPDFVSDNEDINDLAPGDYTIIASDDEGCVSELTISILENTEITYELTTVEPTCLLSNGSIVATPTGGTVADDYSFFWYDVDGGSALISTTDNITDVDAGTYLLEIFDDLGCIATELIGLSNNNGTIESAIQEPLCFGDTNGSIDITVLGMTGDLIYSWEGPNGFVSSDEDIADLAEGTYNVEVIDENGCEQQEVFELIAPELLEVTLTVGTALCNDGSLGAVNTDVTGGTGDYSFNWTGDNGYVSTEQSPSDLPEGCYQVVVTDENLCTATAEICIDMPEPITVDFDVMEVFCFGESTGGIEIDVQGGSPEYSYSWSGPNDFVSNDEDLNDIAAGDYVLTVTDLNLCEFETTITVIENDLLFLDVEFTPPTCPGAIDGAIVTTPGGGTPEYEIEWTGDITGTDFEYDGLSAGVYEYAMNDAFGCIVTGTVELIDPESIQLDSLVTNISCFGDNNGSIEIEPSLGVGEYDFLWTGDGFFSTDQNIYGLEPGLYQLTVQDENGCSVSAEFEITEPEELEVSIVSFGDETCSGAADGFIDIDVIGGTGEYTFSWTGDNYSSDQEDALGLSAGNYDFIVTDENDCSVELTAIPVVSLGSVEAAAPADSSWCYGIEPVFFGIQSGGVSEGWTDIDGNLLSDSSSIAITFDPGVYELIYFAQDGPCTATDTMTIEIFELPMAEAGDDWLIYPEEQVILGGAPSADDGDLTEWTPAELLIDDLEPNPQTVEMFESTYFYLNVTDENGCTASDSVLVEIIPEIVITDGLTPNNDGINDTWVIQNSLLYPSIVVQVFNRWGDLLFESPGYTEEWDGNFNGKPLPVGTYYYAISIDEPDYQTTITGPITILR